MRVKSFNEALHFARCAGEDVANKRMRKAGRTAWSESDHDRAVRETERVLIGLGYDVARWTATAGVPRNEPDEPKTRRKPKRRSNTTPVQLSFTFA